MQRERLKITTFLFALITLLVGVIVGCSLYHHVFLKKTIDIRAEKLGIMQYSSEQDKMIPKDGYKWILKYLKDGTME